MEASEFNCFFALQSFTFKRYSLTQVSIIARAKNKLTAKLTAIWAAWARVQVAAFWGLVCRNRCCADGTLLADWNADVELNRQRCCSYVKYEAEYK